MMLVYYGNYLRPDKWIYSIGFLLFTVFSGFQEVFGQEFYFSNPVPVQNINTDAEESKPIVSQDGQKLFFVRTLHEENKGGIFGGQDIWMATKKQNGDWGLPNNDFAYINNKGNNAVVGLSNKKELIYLLNSYQGNNSKRAGVSYTVKENGKWTKPSKINIPSLSGKSYSFYDLWMVPEGNILIVALNNSESIGKEDLFVSLKNENNQKWSPLIHMGSQINSEGFEIAPFLNSTTDTLFFASNGYEGEGGADIYYSVRQDNSWRNWSKPVNLGPEINSQGFDAYFYKTKSREVFFVSDRGKQATDVYKAEIISEEQYKNDQLTASNASNNEDEEPVNPEEQALIDETKALIEETESLLNEYRTVQERGKWIVDSLEDKSRLNAGNIYFAMDSYALPDTAKATLKKIAANLKTNPGVRVEIIGHADDPGEQDYNLRLSLQRARTVKEFLSKQGIEGERIISYGRGEKEPLVTDNTDEGGGIAKNRRVEINYLQINE